LIRTPREEATLSGVESLDDEDYPSITMGRAAELLGVQPPFLRRLEAAGVLSPTRTDGNHRLYSRRQLEVANRMRALVDEGLSLDAAARIAGLEDDLGAAHARISELEDELDAGRTPKGKSRR
jgi:DNA-binding transcriptional MerR regulator